MKYPNNDKGKHYKKLLSSFIVLYFTANSGIAQIVFTEIMYNPPGSDEGHEWIEIQNTGSQSIDLASWNFYEAGVNHALNPVSTQPAPQNDSILEPHEYAVIVDNPEKFLQDYPEYAGTLLDSSWGSLSNTGESLVMKEGLDIKIITEVVYDSSWGASSNGRTLEKIDVLGGDDPGNWAESRADGGTPGTQNSIIQTTTTSTTTITQTTTTSTTLTATTLPSTTSIQPTTSTTIPDSTTTTILSSTSTTIPASTTTIPSTSTTTVPTTTTTTTTITQTTTTSTTSTSSTTSTTITETTTSSTTTIPSEQSTTIKRCVDKTRHARCSITQPYYCLAGTLVEKCSLCGCPDETSCVNEKCHTKTPTPTITQTTTVEPATTTTTNKPTKPMTYVTTTTTKPKTTTITTTIKNTTNPPKITGKAVAISKPSNRGRALIPALLLALTGFTVLKKKQGGKPK